MTSATPDTSDTAATPATLQRATLGGGCFWCLEAVYVRVRGVHQVVSGYAGGHVPNPTYEQVCGKRTGHAEVVQLTFDPAEISYRELLEILFAIHDPTTPDRQGGDVGPQYRSIILTHDDEQAQVARALIAELEADGTWDAPVVTQVEALTTFYPAEAEHHRYYERNPAQGYCQVVVAPKVAKLRRSFAEKLKE